MTDEDAIALLDRIPSLQSLGHINEYGHGPPVWRVAPNIVVKLLSSPSEFFMMDFVSSNTSIPIPQILKCVVHNGRQYLLIEYVDGSDLHELWPTLNLWRRIWVAWALRSAPLLCEGHHFTEGGVGPFASYAAMADWYNGRSRLTYLLFHPSVTQHTAPPQTIFFDKSMPLVFTHGDISMTNVRVGADGKVWLLDWERAGAYPLWFEYANMMAYAQKVNFGERYDALIWPRGWKYFVPFIAGRYRKQLSFLLNNAVGIGHYGFEGFD
ncbi:hypothetical protein H0H87_002925 [Tephrocybe sp. NHM501043]|nr:hypothetical protein H0H87_002925 [Tephrocybe sp. NHM501043]